MRLGTAHGGTYAERIDFIVGLAAATRVWKVDGEQADALRSCG